MKIFISWSGELSQSVAMILRTWLRNVIQIVEPYVSSEDIEKGARWFAEIDKNLEEAKFGIVCLTRENMSKPWVLFEAGAISRSIEHSRVTPLLIDLAPADVSGPLVHFQAASINEREMLRLTKNIAAQLKDKRFSGSLVESSFKKWWPDFHSQVNAAIRSAGSGKKQPHVRSERELLEEILDTTRSIAQQAVRENERTITKAVVSGTPIRPEQFYVAQIIGGLEKRKRRLLIAALQGAKTAQISDDTLLIEFDPEAHYNRDVLAKPDNLKLLQEVVREVFERPIEIQLQVTRQLF
ncbi:MAG: TIR domain-containing protein [Acidobacteriota bacterium]